MGPVRWVTKDGKRVQYRDWMTDPADVITLLMWTNEKLGINYRAIEADFAPFLLRSARAAGVAVCRAQQVHAHRRGPQQAGPLRDGRRHDPRRRLLRLEGFRRLVPPRDGVDLPRPAAAEDAARGAGLLVLLQARASSPTRRGTARPTTPSPCLEGIDFGCRSGRDLLALRPDLRLGRPRASRAALRVVIDQARQVGANLVTYILGSFQLGPVPEHAPRSTTRPTAPSRDDFVFAQIDPRGRLGPRSLGRPQPAEVRPRQLDAGREVQAGERAAEGPEDGHVSAAVHDRAPRVRLEHGRGGDACSGT